MGEVKLPPAIADRTQAQVTNEREIGIRRKRLKSAVRGPINPPRLPDSTDVAREMVAEIISKAGQGQDERVMGLVRMAYEQLGEKAYALLRGGASMGHRQKMKAVNELMTIFMAQPEFMGAWAAWGLSNPGKAMDQHLKAQPKELMIETAQTNKLVILTAPVSPEDWETIKENTLGKQTTTLEGQLVNPWGEDALPIPPLKVVGGD